MIFWWSSNSQHGAWAVGSIFALILGIILSVVFGASSSVLRMVLLSLPALLLILALIANVRRGNPPQEQSEAVSTEKEKPKRGESLGELMSILNDEDIDDLRARVKARLEEQIDSADAAEMETFADLLAETRRKRR